MSIPEFTERIPPPFNQEVDDYRTWKECFVIWQNYITTYDNTKLGAVLFLSLDRETKALIDLDNSEILSINGAKKILDILDCIFIEDFNSEVVSYPKDSPDFENVENLDPKIISNEFRPIKDSLVTSCEFTENITHGGDNEIQNETKYK